MLPGPRQQLSPHDSCTTSPEYQAAVPPRQPACWLQVHPRCSWKDGGTSAENVQAVLTKTDLVTTKSELRLGSCCRLHLSPQVCGRENMAVTRMVAERRDPSTPWTPARSRDGRRMVSITQIRKARDHRSGVGGAVRGCQEATTHTWSTAECEHGQLVFMRASRRQHSTPDWADG